MDIDYHEEIDPLSIPYEDNIICKTVHSFMELTGKPLGGHLHVRLTKRIPEQGGLGGGSSDAAATIRALAHFHGFCQTLQCLAWPAELAAIHLFFSMEIAP